MIRLKQVCRVRATHICDEQGVEAIEFVGLFPLVLLSLAIAWQFFLAGHTAVVAAGAAREGARAAVVGESVEQAVTRGSPGFTGRRRFSLSGPGCGPFAGGAATVRVELQLALVPLPLIGAIESAPWVPATATMRCEPPYQSP